MLCLYVTFFSMLHVFYNFNVVRNAQFFVKKNPTSQFLSMFATDVIYGSKCNVLQIKLKFVSAVTILYLYDMHILRSNRSNRQFCMFRGFNKL